MKNIFVTGGTGFIGSYFLKEALKERFNLFCIRRENSKTKIKLKKSPIWISGELGDNFKEHLSSIDTLVHIAAVGVSPQVASKDNLLKYNIILPYRLFLDAINMGIKKFIVIGTYAEYGLSGNNYNFIPENALLQPTSSYAASKSAFLQLLYSLSEEEKLKIIYSRIFSAYGEGQNENNFWPALKKAALSGKDFNMTQGEQIRDFIHVNEVAKKLVSQLKKIEEIPEGISLKNVGSGMGISLKDFALKNWVKWNARGKIKFGSIGYRTNEMKRFVSKI